MKSMIRMIPRKFALYLPIAALLAISNQALGQGAISVGNGIDYNASLTTKALTTDNYFYSSRNELSAQGYSLLPRVESRYSQGILQARLVGDGDFTRWDAPAKLGDIEDYGVASNIVLAPAYRHNFTLDADYHHGHDEAGLIRTDSQNQFSAVQTDRLDEWRDVNGTLKYRFGGDGARANSQLSYSLRDRQYLTNRNLTDILDYQSDDANYTLFYNYSPKTSWVMAVDRIATRFDLNPAGSTARDAVEYRFLTGLHWDATAKTSGDVRVGYYSREPADHADPTGGLAWQAQVQWKPNGISSFELTTGRSSTVSYRTDTRFNDDRNAAINWKQAWTSRFTSRAGYTYLRSRFVGAGITDKTHGAGVELEYAALPKLSFTAGGRYLGRESNQSIRKFDTLRADVGITLRL